MVIDRENAIGVILLVLCGAVAVVLLYSIATGTRFRWEGPGWVGPVLLVVFVGASIWMFVTRPGRRWPWDRWRNRDQQDGPPSSDL